MMKSRCDTKYEQIGRRSANRLAGEAKSLASVDGQVFRHTCRYSIENRPHIYARRTCKATFARSGGVEDKLPIVRHAEKLRSWANTGKDET